jgi:hypothetical protein
VIDVSLRFLFDFLFVFHPPCPATRYRDTRLSAIEIFDSWARKMQNHNDRLVPSGALLCENRVKALPARAKVPERIGADRD